MRKIPLDYANEQADNLMYAEKPENRRSFHKLYRTLKL